MMFSAAELALLPVLLLEGIVALYVLWLLTRFVRTSERAAKALEKLAESRRPPAGP